LFEKFVELVLSARDPAERDKKLYIGEPHYEE
jgi:hypothetical protein